MPDAPSHGWTAAVALGPPRAGPRAGRRVAARCSSWPGSTRSNASSSACRSAPSRPCATGWPRPWSPSRRPRPCSTRRGSTARPPPRPWPRPSPDAKPAPRPATASRCWPASASPPSTRFHLYFRRVLVLDELLRHRPARSPDRLGEELLATRAAPPAPPPLTARGRLALVLICDVAVDGATRSSSAAGSVTAGRRVARRRSRLARSSGERERAVLGGQREVERGQRRPARGGG